MTKHIEARDYLEATGDENGAWTIAQQDEGLSPTATKELWLRIAYVGIERDNDLANHYNAAWA